MTALGRITALTLCAAVLTLLACCAGLYILEILP
jgi:hypothetical protein